MIITSRKSGLPRPKAKAKTAPKGRPKDSFAPREQVWTPSKPKSFPAAKAEPADDFTHLFKQKQGWTGADGTYSVPMPDGSTTWLFSDTFWGRVTGDGRRDAGWLFLNNTVASQNEPGALKFLHGGQPGQPQTVFTPPDKIGWFWLHDGLADESGKLTVMLGQFDKTPEGGALGFEAVGAWLAEMEMSTEGPRVTKYQKLPHFQEAGPGQPAIFFGSAMMREKDYTYVYGVADHAHTKDSLLARVKPGRLSQAKEWEFFDGESWTQNMDEAKPIADDVSVEYSVHKSKLGDYVMVAQRGGASADVQVRRSPRPEGPWSEPETVWTAPEHQGSDMTYNAKAHPELSDERGLLVSYNVNTVDGERNLNVADIYRPRFIRVKDQSLLPNQEPKPR